jgi:hypothetical protein
LPSSDKISAPTLGEARKLRTGLASMNSYNQALLRLCICLVLQELLVPQLLDRHHHPSLSQLPLNHCCTPRLHPGSILH